MFRWLPVLIDAINVITALMLLYIMQASTCSPLRMTTPALLRELHRLALCALAFALVVAAATSGDQRPIDIVVNIMLMFTAAFWVARYVIHDRRAIDDAVRRRHAQES